MPGFPDHLTQAKSNLDFLNQINTNCTNSWDWQVTVAFYSALHLVNAIIADKVNQHYRSHEDVDNAINPFNKLSPSKFPEDVYLSYTKLQALSRRARYLVNEDRKNKENNPFFTHSVHLSRSLYHLDILINYFTKEYGTVFDLINVQCPDLKHGKCTYFQPISV